VTEVVITAREDGAVVSIWTAVCHDCGFRSGLARVSFPDGSGALLTGAGCRSRRGVIEAQQWAAQQRHWRGRG
jgi:hypothetical protein